MAKLKTVDSQDGGEQLQVLVLEDGTEVALDEVDKGYLRQSDYTKKTQELAQKTRALEEQGANHQVKDVIDSQAHENPDLANMTKMYLDMQMTQLGQKYGEGFDEVAVINEATKQLENGIPAANIDFEKIHRAMAYTDASSIEAKVREQVLAELAEKQIDTSSIISTMDGISVKDSSHGLTPQEKAYCDRTGFSYEEYAKYK